MPGEQQLNAGMELLGSNYNTHAWCLKRVMCNAFIPLFCMTPKCHFVRQISGYWKHLQDVSLQAGYSGSTAPRQVVASTPATLLQKAQGSLDWQLPNRSRATFVLLVLLKNHSFTVLSLRIKIKKKKNPTWNSAMFLYFYVSIIDSKIWHTTSLLSPFLWWLDTCIFKARLSKQIAVISPLISNIGKDKSCRISSHSHQWIYYRGNNKYIPNWLEEAEFKRKIIRDAVASLTKGVKWWRLSSSGAVPTGASFSSLHRHVST